MYSNNKHNYCKNCPNCRYINFECIFKTFYIISNGRNRIDKQDFLNWNTHLNQNKAALSFFTHLLGLRQATTKTFTALR